jgi:hypothetical protein
MLRWLADTYDHFMVNDWWFWRWIVYAYLAVMALFLVASPSVRQNVANNAHRLSCHVNELAFGTSSEWGSVDCEAWFYRR